VQITVGKKKKIFYNSCVGIMVRFLLEQSHIRNF
jgi:hypothetical protein